VTEIVLVRHGQANSAATDEASYDQLSDLGRQQATWLGDHMRGHNERFNRVISGTLQRQQDTASAMGYGPDETDARLNELSYFALTQAVEAQHGIPAPQEAAEFARYLPEVMGYWAAGHLDNMPERFEDFTGRIEALIDEVCTGHGKVLLVTSGGVISMIVRHVLMLDMAATAKVMLHINNSSLHRLQYVHGGLMLGMFNATPHLDRPDRAAARTFI